MNAQIPVAGNTTGPVELRHTNSGKVVGTVTVAVSRKRGETEETDFFRVKLWGSLAENAALLDKGTRVVLFGRMESREWEKDGEKRTVWEVTADAFGPDLRWATAVVTKTGGRASNAAPVAVGGEFPAPVGWDADAPF